MTAGSANTNSFVLAQATLMMSVQTDVFTLNPSMHSVGLVKNLMVSMTPTYVDLTQGVRGARVASELTNSVTKISAEVFEYTSSNMGYALGIVGSTLTTPFGIYNATAPLATGATTLQFTATSGSQTPFVAGAWVMIQDPVFSDHAYYVQLSGNATFGGGIVTINFTGFPVIAGNNFTTAPQVSLVNAVAIGLRADAPYLSAKLVAPLANGDTIGIIMPKVRVVKGFNIAFGVEKYDDMPFELDPYDLLPGDPMYGNFPSGGCAMLVTNA